MGSLGSCKRVFFPAVPLSTGQAEDIVVNLSSRSLSQEEHGILNLGLGYVPTPRYNAFRTRVDLFKFTRLLKLKSFFGETDTVTCKPWKRKSNFIPQVQ